MKKTIAIIHFNTPELTECCIMSIRKQGCYWPVVVFDNSADITAPAGTNGNDPKEDTIIKARPFRRKMKGVKVIDNTKGQVINFEQFLSLYPDRNPQLGVYKSSVWGSAKHIVTVQKLWEFLPDGFILVESDTLVKRDITELWKEQYSFCGYVQRNQNGNRFKVPRILPMLCYMNVPKLTKEGARYFDPDRCWGLKADANLRGNWFDTGACLLDDVLRMRPRLVGLHVDIRLFIEHYGGGSWHQGDLQRQSAWLKQHEALWEPVENNNAKIFICAHTDFEQAVWNDVYEVIDSREIGEGNVPSLFYSELWQMMSVSKRKKLPKYIGFVQYRKYLSFMDKVPALAKLIDERGAITTQPIDLGMTMREQYATWGNPADLDLMTDIIREQHPDMAEAWDKALESRLFHPASIAIMKTEDWREMFSVAWDVANEYLRRIGGDIVARVKANEKAYHIGEYDFTTLTHEIRVGGQICERIVSAWMDWKFPNAAVFPMKVIGDKIEVTFTPTSKPKTAKRTKSKKE